jgi:SpoVK/Ycf46/Vps4 family AAA+-type ATPase
VRAQEAAVRAQLRREAAGGGWRPPPGGFAAVGGLTGVKRCLREAVLLPLAYPQLYGALGITPPR